MDLTLLRSTLSDLSQPEYRFRQITSSYFKGQFKSFSEYSNLSKDLRTALDSGILFSSFKNSDLVKSPGTSKALLTLQDNSRIETVLMDYDQWLTVCISTQVGCPMGCTFCATGKMGFKRNLTAEEIIDQIVFWNQQVYPKYISRVVFMGMGEPFANWDNLFKSIDIINHKDYLNIGARKISISTSGLVPQIRQFAQSKSQINLAISLHSAIDATRSSIMPVNKTYPIKDLVDAALYYVRTTNRQLFFEYALIQDVNDTPREISALIKLIKSHHLFFLNLIPLNPVSGGLIPTPPSKIKIICGELDRQYVPYSLRRSFGTQINAACGQLAANLPG